MYFTKRRDGKCSQVLSGRLFVEQHVRGTTVHEAGLRELAVPEVPRRAPRPRAGVAGGREDPVRQGHSGVVVQAGAGPVEHGTADQDEVASQEPVGAGRAVFRVGRVGGG